MIGQWKLRNGVFASVIREVKNESTHYYLGEIYNSFDNITAGIWNKNGDHIPQNYSLDLVERRRSPEQKWPETIV